MNLKPIKLLPIRERVASALRKAILSQQFSEGEELTLDGVSRLLGVSVTPVREAFQLLDQDGLLKLRPNKVAVVLGINEKFIREHFELRMILESEMVRKICRNPEIDISQICKIVDDANNELQNNKYDMYTDYNQAFHMAIWDAAGNERIKNILSSLWNGLSMGRDTTEKQYALNSHKEHILLLDAIIERNAVNAGELMCDHIQRSMSDMLTHIRGD